MRIIPKSVILQSRSDLVRVQFLRTGLVEGVAVCFTIEEDILIS